MSPTNSLTYDHAIRFRPKGYSTKVWAYCVSEAIMNKAWALRILKSDPAWVHRASGMAIEMLGTYLSRSVIDLAKESYDYLRLRAFGQHHTGPLDPSARRRWERVNHRRVPPTQYWLYDHRSPLSARLYKFNAKRGWGWIKKSKRELKGA